MHYEGDIFRPPSEAESLLLQVTVGCSHNRCTFCGMYAKKTFRMTPLERVFADIAECAPHANRIHRIFLCDGDALILPQAHLEAILARIRSELPHVRRISTYGDSRAILGKSPAELRRLRELGLSLVYEGLESGDDAVLGRIGKRATRAEMVEASKRLQEAGIRHSVMFILGLAGQEESLRHAEASATLLSEVDPAFAAALTLTLVPGTPLAEEARAGRFVLPDRFGMLRELLVLLKKSRPSQCLFSANHASNYLPIQGWLPRDGEKLVSLVEHVLATRDDGILVPEWARGL